MNYSIDTDFDSNLITVTYTADTTYSDRVEILDKLVTIIEKHSNMNVLIDARKAKENMTVDEQKDYGKLIGSKFQYFTHRRTAVLALRRNNPHPHIISHAYLNGVKSICEFNNRLEALSWLGGEIH